jgi:predicted nucleotidyltransferase
MLLFGRPHDDSKGQSSSVDTEASRRFDTALFSTLDALEARKIEYGLIGGVAAFTHGRPRPTQDIDIFVRPEDADNTLEVLKEFGFETNRFNPSWIFKAYKENVLIDIIFRSEGNLYFDEEMSKHTQSVHYHGRPVRVVSPEDFIIIKAAAHSEEGHHHWHDALAVLSQAQVDWEYLLHRARKAPRRLLALLIYAQSVDMFVPNHHVQRLYQSIFENTQPHRVEPKAIPRAKVNNQMGDTYLAAKIREALAKNESTGALDIEVFVQEEKILVRGQAHSEEQRKAIFDLIKQTAPNLFVENQVQIPQWSAPKDIEALQ